MPLIVDDNEVNAAMKMAGLSGGKDWTPQKEFDREFSSEEEVREWMRCATDPAYFISKYGWMSDPVLGHVKFDTFPYQRGVMRQIMRWWANIILKPRQMGISWLMSGMAVWLCNFHTHKNVLKISIKENTAKRLLAKSKYIYRHIPPYLKSGLANGRESRGEIGTATVIEFNTDSRIESIPTSEEAGRSEGVSLLIIDEAAFVRWLAQIWAAAYPTLSTGGMCTMLSTANGMGNEFHKFWVDACRGESDFFPIRLKWQDFPGRDEAWYASQLRNLGPQRCAQEVDCDFLQSGNPVFDIPEVKALEECSTPPIRRMWNGYLLVWEDAKPHGKYVIGADTATGEGASWQAAIVTDRDTGRDVACYHSKAPIEAYAGDLSELGRMYNNAIIGVEKNNMGRAVIVHLQRRYPDNLLYRPPKGDAAYFVPGVTEGEAGWDTNSKTKPMMIQNFAASVRGGHSGVRSPRLIGEMYVYIYDGTSTHAMEGYSDDLVMAKAIAMEVIRTTLWIPRDLPIGGG